MTEAGISLKVLLVEDDKESLGLLSETLPKILDGYNLEWESCESFETALTKVHNGRYDLVVTDIYRDRKDIEKRCLGADDDKAKDIIKEIRKLKFCPIVAFSSGSAPDGFPHGPFIKFADKSAPENADLLLKLSEVLKTGIPQIARKLHDEVDGIAGSYLWQFLEKNWDQLDQASDRKPDIIERLVRRRASIQIGRLDSALGGPAEIKSVEGLEYYICPPISKDTLRLGEILKHKDSGSYRVVLNPHCHLLVQPGAEKPRAEKVLLVDTFGAADMLKEKPPEGGNEEKRLESLRRYLQSPPRIIGQLEQRYWFLPRFLDMPDLYCDFLSVRSELYENVISQYEGFAVLDAPFSEAFQACFVTFYSAVGLPDLDPVRFTHLFPATE